MASARRRRRGALPTGLSLLIGLLTLWWLSHAPWSVAEAPAPAPTAATVQRPTATPDTASSDATPAAPSVVAAEQARIPTVAVDPRSVWASSQACEASIGSIASRPRRENLRIASWNLHWFPDARSDRTSKSGGTDVAWMACAMASLRADVIAVQEVMTNLPGRSALSRLLERLDQLTQGRWHSYIDECPADRRQHVGLLYDRTRVDLEQLRQLPELNPYGSPCAKRLRPGVGGRLRRGAIVLDLITLHFDSGTEERDYRHRVQSVQRLTEGFPAAAPTPVLALGDFNTMGCETCAPPAGASDEVAALDTILSERGYRTVPPQAGQPACSEHFQGRAQLLDRAITTLPAHAATFHSAGLCAELACQRPKTTSDALLRLSDHCPIVVEVAPFMPTPR